jgi:4-amino-4-deoxy-L-arabinose transferase-like glycosyltransferase
MLVKPTAGIALVALPLSALLLLEHGRGRSTALRRWAPRALLAAGLAVAVDAVMRLSDFYGHIEGGREQNFHTPAHVAQHFVSYAEANRQIVVDSVIGYAGIPLLLAALVGTWAVARSGRAWRAALLVTVVLVSLGLVLVAATFPYPRYLIAAMPEVAVLGAAGVVHIGRQLEHLRLRRSVATALVAGAAIALPSELTLQVLDDPATARYPSVDYWQYVSGWPAGTGLNGISQALVRAPGARVDIATDWVPPYNLATKLGDPVVRVKDGHADAAFGLEVFNGRRTFRFLSHREAPGFSNARFFVHLEPVPDDRLSGKYQLVASWQRPENGSEISLWRRVGRH